MGLISRVSSRTYSFRCMDKQQDTNAASDRTITPPPPLTPQSLSSNTTIKSNTQLPPSSAKSTSSRQSEILPGPSSTKSDFKKSSKIDLNKTLTRHNSNEN